MLFYSGYGKREPGSDKRARLPAVGGFCVCVSKLLNLRFSQLQNEQLCCPFVLHIFPQAISKCVLLKSKTGFSSIPQGLYSFGSSMILLAGHKRLCAVL